MGKTKQKTHKALTVLLALTMVLALAPAAALTPQAAYGDVGIDAGADLSAGANLTGTQVYFGEYNEFPILWYVVATDSTAGTATLWTTTSMGDMRYDPSGHNLWSGSEICAWLNGTDGFTATGFLPNAFSTAEQDAITPYGTTET